MHVCVNNFVCVCLFVCVFVMRLCVCARVRLGVRVGVYLGLDSEKILNFNIFFIYFNHLVITFLQADTHEAVY